MLHDAEEQARADDVGGTFKVQTSTTPSATSNAEWRWSRWLARAPQDERLGERMRYVTILVGAGLLEVARVAADPLERDDLGA